MTHDNPCSVPDFLRVAYPMETEEQQAVCRLHDARYKAGGSHTVRLAVDLEFAMNLLHAGMTPDMVDQYFIAVRWYGGIFWAGGDMPGAPPLQPPERVETA